MLIYDVIENIHQALERDCTKILICNDSFLFAKLSAPEIISELSNYFENVKHKKFENNVDIISTDGFSVYLDASVSMRDMMTKYSGSNFDYILDLKKGEFEDASGEYRRDWLMTRLVKNSSVQLRYETNEWVKIYK